MHQRHEKVFSSSPFRGGAKTIDQSRAEAVADGMGMKVDPAVVDTLLHMRDQVVTVKHASCPVGWSRHSEHVDHDQGVVWRDGDGNYCAPPSFGSEKSRVPVEPIDLEDRNMRSAIVDLSNRMDALLNEE